MLNSGSNPLDPYSVIEVNPRSQLSPRIGIAHPISDKTKLHFAYGHFFQNPNSSYLFENNQYDLNVREPLFGQPNLDAERTIAYEVGIPISLQIELQWMLPLITKTLLVY